MKNNKTYIAKCIPLAFDQSLSYYECICNITNYINKDIIPVVNETNETVIILSNKFDDLKKYVDDNMLTKDVNNLTYYTKTVDLAYVALTGNYNDLSNKPTIPTKTSDLDNDSGYITKDVNDLTYYTLTSNLATVATSGNYNDLSNKPTIPDVSNFITKDVNDLTYYTLTSNLSSVATSGNYNDLSNKPTIPTVPTNISAFTNDTGYITATNYASSSVCGVIKVNSYYGTSITNTGALQGGVKTYSTYTNTNSTSNNALISKGTLENVIEGKGLVSNDMAIINASDKSITGNTAWTTYTFGFTSSDSFITSDSNLFEFDSNGIKCKFNGTVLIIRAMTLDGGCNDKEFDLIDEYGSYNLLKGVNKNSFSAKTVSTNDVISLQYISEVTSFTAYRTRIIVVRLK